MIKRSICNSRKAASIAINRHLLFALILLCCCAPSRIPNFRHISAALGSVWSTCEHWAGGLHSEAIRRMLPPGPETKMKKCQLTPEARHQDANIFTRQISLQPVWF